MALRRNTACSTDSARWLVALPFQFTATHRGGQIDTIDTPLQTLFNVATGLRVRRAADVAVRQRRALRWLR